MDHVKLCRRTLCSLKQNRAKLATLSPEWDTSLEHLGLSHIPGGSSTAAATAARNHPRLPPWVRGWGRLEGFLWRPCVSAHSPPHWLHPFQGHLAKSPGSVRGSLPKQALGHLTEVGEGQVSGLAQDPQKPGGDYWALKCQRILRKKVVVGRVVVVAVLCYLKVEKFQEVEAFFSICSLAVPLENSRRLADDIMSYNWEISVILWNRVPACSMFPMEAALYLCV